MQARVEELDLSVNDLEVLDDSLNALDALCALDVSVNQIRAITPSLQLSSLRTINLSQNCLSAFPDLSLPVLARLDLSYNHITQLSLQGVPRLTHLTIDHNMMASLDALSSVAGLEHLSASHNALESIHGCMGLPQLRVLDISHNRLSDYKSTLYCLSCMHVRDLRLLGNPLCQQPQYRHVTDFIIVDFGMKGTCRYEIPLSCASIAVYDGDSVSASYRRALERQSRDLAVAQRIQQARQHMREEACTRIRFILT